MISGLEEKIIAFFEGGLSDADSAELLHMVSVSPEIRDLFREHQMLRELALKATRSVMVNPEVEASIFSRVEVLAGKEPHEKPVFVFSRRTALVAALMLILLSGSLGYFVPKFFSENTQPVVSSPIQSKSEAPISSSVLSLDHSLPAIAQLAAYSESKSEADPKAIPILESQVAPAFSQSESVESTPYYSSEIHPAGLRSENIPPDIGGERLSPFERKEIPQEFRSLFEISFQTSSGFTYPANATPIAPFADQRLSFGYHITENNLIGFRLGSGLYQELGNVSSQEESGVEVLTRNIETKRSFSEELYFSHLEPIYFFAPFTLEFSLGGGFIPNGYTLDAEAGIRIPLAESWMIGFDFALSRIHSNALSSSAILALESSMTMKPILLESIDIHNTLNGRLHYGLIYRF
jgi:hypothetical protein